MNDDGTPVREAATVLLVRPQSDAASGPAPTDRSLEVLTLTRSSSLVFSAGVTAFPGGKVEPSDPSVAEAAVRETFEETGVLLARRADGAPPGPQELERIPADAQERVERDAETFRPLLATLGLIPDSTGMRLLSRWITPTGQPRRYDTHFFVAAVPPGQEPRRLSGESVSWQWLTPVQALADFRAGRRHVMPPTWSLLRTLAEATTVDEALQLPSREETVEPRVFASSPPRIVRFPDHEAYEQDVQQFRAHSD